MPRPNGFKLQQLLAAGAVSSTLLLSLSQGLHAERSSERLLQGEAVKAGLEETTSEETKSEGSKSDETTALEARPYRITPERRALLNTIRYAEGTWKDGRDLGYRVMYGGSLFRDLSKHPERVVVKRYASAAAGAYQFLPGTWHQVARELKLPNFEPPHQDQAALRLVERRGALKEVDQHGLTPSAMNRLAPEWASFPTHAGKSAYGQPVKSHAELARFYSSNLKQIRQGA